MKPTHLDSLSDGARSWLDALARRDRGDELYLAGSAALALYLAHRPVSGLDLMSAGNRLTGPERRDLLAELVEVDPALVVETARDGFLYARTGAGEALRFFYYPYPLIDPEEEALGLAVASAVDLALMKLAAVVSRASRRDFVDLYLLSRELPLERTLERAAEKFGHVRDFPLQALKALADLDAVGDDPMPRLAVELAWDDIERWVRTDVRDLARRAVGL